MIRAVDHIEKMSPYALAELKAPAGKRVVSLSQNEALRAPSPLAIEAAASALAAGHLYPDPDWWALRVALAERHAIAAAGILCGNGSMELIGCLTRAFADEQGAVLAPAHAYPFFETATRLARARFDRAPETRDGVSVDALLDAVRPDTRIVLVANPGNPTGTRISRSELCRLRNGLPGQVLLVIDEAYGEFADRLDAPMFDLIDGGDTVVLRTFSKAYALAGMRVGWGYFPTAIADQLRKVMNPNNVSAAGQAAAAAALVDQGYMRETCALTGRLRDRFVDRLRLAGFNLTESFTNFAIVRFASIDAARRADGALRAEGVIARAQGGAGLPDCLRITIGAADTLDLAAGLLEHWAEAERA
ncbi:histidinol-phosphate aminotransferase/N-methylhydantoinase B [Cribrihabitans marinus]|uniref:histidinol-phosphate transaminase n=1 Tax=Cribrihabitans marinus TaxID=1227549 RepID=A0A1H7DJT2_9RHOB|nr:histidinol-phosphate transaminase [Cribrihabitans marinus]GGH38272.1 histidinol-phosphate aminotransferase [Cribrihabitans marinus]SEJ98495.1 histidinol-phosphate aminotransferase/N-methylhydantoinase B [Cribrihabitans marinus]